jgi:ankyrin repeat protein
MKDTFGKTPLLWAVWYGHDAVVKRLLETGKVELDMKNDSG